MTCLVQLANPIHRVGLAVVLKVNVYGLENSNPRHESTVPFSQKQQWHTTMSLQTGTASSRTDIAYMLPSPMTPARFCSPSETLHASPWPGPQRSQPKPSRSWRLEHGDDSASMMQTWLSYAALTAARKDTSQAQRPCEPRSLPEESDLRCGGHAALSDGVNRAWIKADYSPSALCSDRSGKHAGMLAGALAIGSDKCDYHLLAHPMQVRVKQAVEDLSGAKREEVMWALDGCNLPAPALPLCHLARIYARVASAVDEVEHGDALLLPSRTVHLAEIYRQVCLCPRDHPG